MSLFCRLRSLYLARFSQPACDRVIYRLIRKHGVEKILEIGIGKGRRAHRMLELALQNKHPEAVSFTGVDLFEARAADGAGLSLKAAHRLLKATGAKVRLVPGDPYTALARSANEIGPCDLIIISADQDPTSLSRAWFYVPRLMHASTRVFVEQPAGAIERVLKPIAVAQVRQWAVAAATRRAA